MKFQGRVPKGALPYFFGNSVFPAASLLFRCNLAKMRYQRQEKKWSL